MEITACPVCGSKNIRIGTLSDGIISGLSSWNEVCRNCGYQGAPLVFDSEFTYNKFFEALSNQEKQTGSGIKKIDKGTALKEKDKKTSIHSIKKAIFLNLLYLLFSLLFFS